MPIVEIFILIAVFCLSLWLIYADFDASLTLLLFLSVLLHKEFFSIYRWDLLPIRVFMLAFLLLSLWKVTMWWRRGGTIGKVVEFFKHPFVLLLSLLWVVNGLSIFFSENLLESTFLFGFFTTVAALGITLYLRLKNDPEKVLKLVKQYIYVLFGLTIFGFIQLGVYQKTGFIFGALWNVPDRIPRIGATFWDVNHFAALLASLLPVLGVLILVSKSIKKRILYICMFIPMTAMLLLTNSRSSWILVFVAFVVFVSIVLIKKWGSKGVYGLLLVLAIVSAGITVEYSDKSSPFRAKVKDYFHYRIDSFDSHFMLLKGAFQIFEAYPYLGGGFGGFFEQFSKTETAPVYFGRDPISLASGLRAPGHSIWGELFAETGAIGGFVYVSFVCLLVGSLLHISLKEADAKKSLMVAAMVSAVIGWFVAGVFYSYKAEFFWIILFLYFLYGIGVWGSRYKVGETIQYFLRSEKLPYIILLFLGVLLIFFGLGRNHLVPWDEAIYAKVAKNMVTTGDYITQRWDLGRVWYEKPPLYMWAAAASMKIFGIGEFASRFPSALFGFLAVVFVYKFGKELFSKTSGFIAAVALITTTQFLYYSRASMLDVSVTFFVLASMFFYWRAHKGNGGLYKWILTGVFIGLGGMVKNVVGLLPLLIIALYEFYLLTSGNERLTAKRIRNYLVMLLSSALVFLPWHIEMYRLYGKNFIDNYVMYHIVKRGTAAIEDKGKPLWWYLIVMKVSMRIWFVALLGAFPFSIFFTFFKRSKKHAFLVIWSVVIFVFFSWSKSKLVWYIIPIYPVAALIVGRFVDRVLGYVIKKFSVEFFPVVKSVAVYSILAFALFYLFLVKGLVYTDDLTGAQAMLLQEKEEKFGKCRVVYVDKVALPVMMFYLDGPFKQVEHGWLESKLKHAGYEEPIVYVTKTGRQDRLDREGVRSVVVNTIKDHVLGFRDSDYSLDSTRLQIIIEEENRLLRQIESLSLQQLPVPERVYDKLRLLAVEKVELSNKIEVGLAAID